MNTKDAIAYCERQLSAYNISNALMEAQMILCHLLNRSASDLYSNLEYKLDNSQIQHLQNILNRRSLKEPLSYLFNQCEFYGLDFYVDYNVLIPRPETELLVEEAIQFFLEINRVNNSGIQNTMADIGTGCGAIAICLSKYIDNVKIYATDISIAALEIAKRNSYHHHLISKICFIHGDLLDFTIEPLDLIVANLPYVKSSDLNSLYCYPFYEPRIALDGGADGLEVIERLLKDCKSKLKRNAGILLEIAYDQDKKVKSLINSLFSGSNLTFVKDYNGYNRIARILI